MPTTNLAQRAVAKLLRPLRRWEKARDLANVRSSLGSFPAADPVVMILTPGSLHLARLAWGFVPADVPLVLILNGLDAWETAWVRANLPSEMFIASKSLLGHAEIIDASIDRLKTGFGLLDHDCLVLNPQWFSLLASGVRQNSMSGCFPFVATGEMNLLHTFFLWINPQVCRSLKHRFGVSAAEVRWEQVSPSARDKLAQLGYLPGHYPEPDKAYFDTLRLLQLLSIAEDVPPLTMGRLDGSPVPNTEALHIGGVSYRDVILNFWVYRGCFFWRSVLQITENRELADYYGARFGDIRPERLASDYPEFARQLDPKLVDFVMRLVSAAKPKRNRSPSV